MPLSQWFILICSCLSILLFSTKKWYRYGFVIGIIGQPFWIYATYVGEQWGMFLVSIWYVIFQIKGICNHFERIE